MGIHSTFINIENIISVKYIIIMTLLFYCDYFFLTKTDCIPMTLLQWIYLYPPMKVGFHNSPGMLQQTAVQFFCDSPGVESPVSALAAPCHTCNQ